MNKRDFRNLVKRDKKTIEEWFKNSSDSVYTFIYYRVAKDRELAFDVLQETFLEALKRINEYQPEKGSMFAWMTYLSRNYIKNALKQKSKFSNHLENNADTDGELTAAFEKIAVEPLPDEIIEKKETAELVQITLAGMPKKYRDVLNEFYYQQKMIKEIASFNGQSQIAVKITLYRARNAFKKSFLKISKSLHDTCPKE